MNRFRSSAAITVGLAGLLVSSVVLANGYHQVAPEDFRITGDFKRGEKLFANSCSPCHGAKGDGKGVVKLDGIEMPDLRDRMSMTGQTDWEIYRIIADGGEALGRCDTMLASGHRLEEASIQDLAAFVKTLPANAYVERQRRD